MTLPVAIIGAGPAGIEAAVQLRRSGIEFLLFEKDRVGGLLNEANRVENFPGVPGGVPGRILADRLKRQLTAATIHCQPARVGQLAFHGENFELHTERKAFTAVHVILACGTAPLPVPAPLDREDVRGRVVTSVLPLRGKRGRKIAVIGGGDAALDYALSLAAGNEVHILVRAAKPRALPLLVERCRRHPAIRIHENCRLAGAEFRSKAAGLVLRTDDGRGGQRDEIACHWALVAIGREPALAFLAPGLQATLPVLAARKRLFLVGDAANGRCRQAAIAAADGLRAAMEIHAEVSPCR
jgi:thioredoxin reductase